LDWTHSAIDWSGQGGGRGLRGIAFHEETVFVAGGSELFCFSPTFELLEVHRSPYLGQVQALACFDGRVYAVSAAFDSVLAFNLAERRFDWGLQIVDDGGGLRGLPFNPSRTTGPSPTNELRLHSVHCDSRGLFLSGLSTMGLLRFDGKGLQRLVTLPEGVRDARPWRDGVLFNDTHAGAVRFLTPEHNRVFEVPLYPESELTPGSFEDATVAIQGFAQGLCVVGGGHFASGSSPLTISLHDLDAMKTNLRINLSTDARQAFHTLAVWPFPVDA
ncbi:MAG: hypothetical protein PVI22_04380, partial [Lysobacterales bacterium]